MRWGCVLSESNKALREMVSALVDGEASEFECRRVLAGMDDPALRGLVDRHYSLRAVVRQEAQLLCPAPLGANILAALEQEPALRAASAAPAGNRWRADGWRQQPAGRATAAPVHGRSCAQRGAQYQPGDDALGPCCQLPKSLKQ